MTNFKWFVGFVLAINMVPELLAETRCPGNVESVPFRLVNRYQMIVPVSVNHSGPYNFLLDTGTQLTMLDPSLVDTLHMQTHGTILNTRESLTCGDFTKHWRSLFRWARFRLMKTGQCIRRKRIVCVGRDWYR